MAYEINQKTLSDPYFYKIFSNIIQKLPPILKLLQSRIALVTTLKLLDGANQADSPIDANLSNIASPSASHIDQVSRE